MTGTGTGQMRILVVDDSTVARKVLRKILAELGHEQVIEASDGMEAHEVAGRNELDLIITDWNMPNMDGLGLVRALKGPGKSGPPMLMVSSESYLSRIVEVIGAGAEGYIRKPFTARDLEQAITEVLTKHELSQQSQENSLMSGQLEQIGFPELLQFLTSANRGGRLVLQLAGYEASVDIRDGEALAASYGELRGDDAIFAIALVDSGSFEFRLADDAVEKNVTMPTMPLLIEAMRRRDEATRALG